jgi:peptidoglycan hydrolase-like protein with peptidoglycan-binding domain
MSLSPTLLRVAGAGLVAALPLLTALPAAAQTQHDHSKPAATVTSAVPATTITALQQALNGQGIAVKVDGVLGEDTRAAIRSYQTQHHLPVTGEPDAATIEKLGIKAGTAASAKGMRPMQGRMAQGGTSQGGMGMGGMGKGGMAQRNTPPAETTQAGMMNCGMMQGDMKQMAQMMQQMQQKMQAMEQRMQGPAPKQN